MIILSRRNRRPSMLNKKESIAFPITALSHMLYVFYSTDYVLYSTLAIQ